MSAVFSLTDEQEQDLLAYARSKGFTPNYLIRHLEPRVRNMITLRRTTLSYDQAVRRIDQLYEESEMASRKIEVANSDIKGQAALSLLEDGYPDDFAACTCMADVYKALDAHGYTFVPALNLWQQQDGEQAEIAITDAVAATDASPQVESVQPGAYALRLFDGLPIRQQEFLTALYWQKSISKNAATRMALRRYGYITDTDDWDAIELTEHGRAVALAGINAGLDKQDADLASPAAVQPDPAPIQDDSAPTPDDPQPFTKGSRVVYTGEFLRLPNGQFGIMPNMDGVITDLIDTAGTIDGAMVRFSKRDGDVSVPLADLKHHDPFINRQGEMNILRGDDKRITLHAGDYISVANKKGHVVQVRAGQGANVMVVMDGEPTPKWVERAAVVILKSVAEPFERQLMAKQTEIFRLRQIVEKREKEESKPHVAPVNEVDMLRAELAKVRAELEAAKAPVQDEPEIPDGDLFSELRTLEDIRTQERARVRLAEPVKKEFKLLTKARISDLEALINDGWQKFDSAFTSDHDGVIDYSIMLVRDVAQPASNGTHKAAVTEPATRLIMPDDIPANGHIEETELSFADALRLRREGKLTTADVMDIGDLEAMGNARQAVEDLRESMQDRPMRHISEIIALPTLIVQEVKS